MFIERTTFESLSLQNINEEYFSKRRLHPVGRGSSSPYVMQCPLQQYKKVTSSEAVGKDKTVKACKHSSIPRKNCFVSRSLCKLRNSCPSRVGSRQIYHLMQRIIKHFSAIYLFFFVISRTMTSQGRSENSDQSRPLHPMLPNADRWKAILQRMC